MSLVMWTEQQVADIPRDNARCLLEMKESERNGDDDDCDDGE